MKYLLETGVIVSQVDYSNTGRHTSKFPKTPCRFSLIQHCKFKTFIF